MRLKHLWQRPARVTKRMAGHFNDRLDGIGDLLFRAQSATVLDIGCNRGMVGFQFLNAGASLVHGCDIYEDGIKIAREIFSEWPAESKFEVVDLAKGPSDFAKAFGDTRYDIVIYLAVHHKLKRVMDPEALRALVVDLGGRSKRWFGYRGPKEDFDEVDSMLTQAGLELVQYSSISDAVRDPAGIWRRRKAFDKAPIRATVAGWMPAVALVSALA